MKNHTKDLNTLQVCIIYLVGLLTKSDTDVLREDELKYYQVEVTWKQKKKKKTKNKK